MANPGPCLRGVLRARVPLLRARLHPSRRLARRLRASDAAPVGLRSAAAPPPRGGDRIGAADERGGVPRRRCGPHAVRGPEAQQPIEQGDELLQGEALPAAAGHAPLPCPAAQRLPNSGAVA